MGSSAANVVQEKGGRVKYVGGSSYLDRIPSTFKFADLSHRLAEKANGAVLVRFQVPGEPLDEDELVSVQDDLDIQVRTGCSAHILTLDAGRWPCALSQGARE